MTRGRKSTSDETMKFLFLFQEVKWMLMENNPVEIAVINVVK